MSLTKLDFNAEASIKDVSMSTIRSRYSGRSLFSRTADRILPGSEAPAAGAFESNEETGGRYTFTVYCTGIHPSFGHRGRCGWGRASSISEARSLAQYACGLYGWKRPYECTA